MAAAPGLLPGSAAAASGAGGRRRRRLCLPRHHLLPRQHVGAKLLRQRAVSLCAFGGVMWAWGSVGCTNLECMSCDFARSALHCLQGILKILAGKHFTTGCVLHAVCFFHVPTLWSFEASTHAMCTGWHCSTARTRLRPYPPVRCALAPRCLRRAGTAPASYPEPGTLCRTGGRAGGHASGARSFGRKYVSSVPLVVVWQRCCYELGNHTHCVKRLPRVRCVLLPQLTWKPAVELRTRQHFMLRRQVGGGEVADRFTSQE